MVVHWLTIGKKDVTLYDKNADSDALGVTQAADKKEMRQNTDIQQLIIDGIQERKGRGITIVDMSHIESAATPKFIIAQGGSPTQVSAIADSVRDYVLEHGDTNPYNYDGYSNSEWIVIDYGDTLVHIFLPEVRLRYNLEDLWSDANIIDVPDLD